LSEAEPGEYFGGPDRRLTAVRLCGHRRASQTRSESTELAVCPASGARTIRGHVAGLAARKRRPACLGSRQDPAEVQCTKALESRWSHRVFDTARAGRARSRSSGSGLPSSASPPGERRERGKRPTAVRPTSFVLVGDGLSTPRRAARSRRIKTRRRSVHCSS
jgi:hypothetical protein